MWMPRLITLLVYCPFDFKALTEKFLLCCRWKEWQEWHSHQISCNSNCLLVHQKRRVDGIRPFYQMLWQETHLLTIFPCTFSSFSIDQTHEIFVQSLIFQGILRNIQQIIWRKWLGGLLIFCFNLDLFFWLKRSIPHQSLLLIFNQISWVCFVSYTEYMDSVHLIAVDVYSQSNVWAHNIGKHTSVN